MAPGEGLGQPCFQAGVGFQPLAWTKHTEDGCRGGLKKSLVARDGTTWAFLPFLGAVLLQSKHLYHQKERY